MSNISAEILQESLQIFVITEIIGPISNMMRTYQNVSKEKNLRQERSRGNSWKKTGQRDDISICLIISYSHDTSCSLILPNMGHQEQDLVLHAPLPSFFKFTLSKLTIEQIMNTKFHRSWKKSKHAICQFMFL